MKTAIACAVLFGLLAAPCPAPAEPAADAAAGELSPQAPADRVAVTIYEFRSSLPAVNARSATDMFTTALVRSGRFRVVERSRMNEGIVREKQLQQAGWASGDAAQQPLRGAQYVFEGTVSEANVAEAQSSIGIGIAGMQMRSGSSRDSIAVDVRVVDAASGDVVDAVTVRKPVASREVGVSGVGSLLGTAATQRGRPSPYVPDVQAQSRTADGLDATVRAAIEEAVAQLSARVGR